MQTLAGVHPEEEGSESTVKPHSRPSSDRTEQLVYVGVELSGPGDGSKCVCVRVEGRVASAVREKD